MRTWLAILCAAVLAGCNVEADFSGDIETEILEAEQYQQEITSIDRLVFREVPLGDDGVKSLETILTGLSKRVGAHSDTKFIKLESLELRLLAERAGGLSPRDRAPVAMQNDWMRIRNNLFDDRAWFARSAADLDYTAGVVKPSTSPKIVRPSSPPVDYRPRAELAGRWQVVSMLQNGKPSDDAELSGSTWTFDAPRLVLRDPGGRETVFNFVAADGYLDVTSASGENGSIKYELDDRGLRVAFFDGLSERPKSFEHDPANPQPPLVVLRLARIH